VTPVLGAALVTIAALSLYAVLGGADFGGGVWDLFASGPRRQAQRDAISRAIGPVWESNHVWLIFAIVALFTCFPPAFADIGTNLNPPLTLALLGIVLRGAAFVFRNHAADTLATRSWTAVFGASSIIAPFFLGDAAGAIATGHYAWTSPFALSAGVFAVALCAQVAAVFLVRETSHEPALRHDFRRRAVRATLAVWIAGLVPALLAYQAEPALFAALIGPTARIAIASAMLLGIVVMLLIANRRDTLARVAVGAEALAVLAGWFGAQAPNLIPGSWTYQSAAASPAMLNAFLIATAIGALFVIPSMLLLMFTFKGSRGTPHPAENVEPESVAVP
jgi:cytochrome d ubiquinol oxidase subunit II